MAQSIARDPLRALALLDKTFGNYRSQLLFLTMLAVVSAVLDGISINAVIPLLSFLLGQANNLPGDFISKAVEGLFHTLHIPYSFRFLLGFIALMFFLRALVLGLFGWLRARISTQFLFRESHAVFNKTLHAPWTFLVSQKAGHLQNTIFWDVRKTSYLLEVMAQFIQSATGFVIYLAIAVSISPGVTLSTLAVGAVLLAALYPFVKRSAHWAQQVSIVEKGFTHHLVEHIGGLKTVKASGMEGSVANRGKFLLNEFRVASLKSLVAHTIGANVIQPFSVVFIFIVLAIAYKMPGFNIASFAATMYLIQKIFTYLQSAQSTTHSLAEHLPYVAHVEAFKAALNGARAKESVGGKPFAFARTLALHDVSLSYVPGVSVLSNVSFSLSRGALVGIVGPSGGGKTSIADIILRLIGPSDGSVLLDDVPIQDIATGEWRQKVGYVSQDVFLMNASIRDNIRFYDEQVTDEAIERAAKQAHIYEHIQGLEQGFDTVIGDRGLMLSGGQRQRIVLARALARNPEILILDEATSALDSESELAIKKAIDELRGSVTILAIAHRIGTILEADSIVVLKEGKIIESGTPAEMLARDDSYLAKIQKLQGAATE